jgi:peptidyl-prolyl cis-trans isomerase B (cyclophilin B)
MRYLLPLLFLFLTACQGDGTTRATIYTNRGEIDVLLYADTPRHTENFVKLANEGFYTGTLFHRVMPGFMIQGGDPDSKGAPPMAPLGRGGPGYELEHEIGAPHIRGALAAARTPNPEKRSSGSQFYIVTGELMADRDLDQIERIKGIKYSEAQREAYRTIGGRPDLDQDYTVFGEVTAGMDVVEEIAEVDVNGQARPLEDVVIERVEIK